MPTHTKIATCCYCSARTFLQPTARAGHELACGSCGAPIHEMKWLKAPEATKRPAAPAKPRKPAKKAQFANWSKSSRPRKKSKRRKSMFSKVLEEAWEFANDLVDDIFD